MRPGLEDVALRPARAADLDAIAALQETAILALGVPTYTPAQARAWARLGVECRHDLLEQGSFFVAEQRGRLVGVGGWSPDSRDPALAWLRYLFVHPELVRRGLGRALVESAEGSARAAGKERFWVWSSLNAVAFYRACGYRQVRAGRWPIAAGIEMDYVLLAKEPAPHERTQEQEPRD